ncbi:M14 family zinc carboxypeptidase [Christiangramia fulva]|nr:M14 family zinc carboxypeptidase [Christiangramia fulva]
MKKYIVILLMGILNTHFVFSQNKFSDRLFANYEKYREEKIKNRRFNHVLVDSLLNEHRTEGIFKIQKVGESIQNRSLNLVSIGHGKTEVLLWSQMHGDEPTATMAIFDILNFFASNDFEEEKKILLDSLSIHFLPMLNPDGAEIFERRNALGVDINRDALRLQSPESKTLKRMRDSLDADFGFNLHDQSRYYNAERTSKPATISFLATAYNYEKDINEVRAKSMKLIVDMNKVLQKYAPAQVGRYNDDFEPRAFGDNIQKWGTSLVLIESGGYPDDREKQVIRKLNFVVILSALKSIATKSYEKEAISDYEKIPENDRMLFDLKLKGITYQIDDKSYILDIGIDQDENELQGEDFYFSGRVVDQGDLSTSYGYEEINASDLMLKFPEVYPKTITSEEELMKLDVPKLIEKGYLFVPVSEEMLQKEYSSFPLNLVSEDFKVKKELRPGIPANFILYQGGKVIQAVINGFLTQPENAGQNVLNSRSYY